MGKMSSVTFEARGPIERFDHPGVEKRVVTRKNTSRLNSHPLVRRYVSEPDFE